MIRTSHRSPKTESIGLAQDFAANLALNELQIKIVAQNLPV